MTSNDNTAPSETNPPPRRRRGLRALIKVVGVLLLLVGAFWLVGVVTEETDSSQDTLSAEAIDRIAVQVDSGRIEIRAEERADVAVTAERVSSLWSQSASSVDVSDGTLSATGGCESTLFMSSCAVNYTILVPESSVTEIEARTTAGQIEIDGSSAEVNAETTAGEIRLIDYSGLSAALTTTAGGVTVEAVTPPETLTVETTAGGVDITVPDAGYRVVTDTTVGNVDVAVDQDSESDRSIVVSTTAGGITISGS